MAGNALLQPLGGIRKLLGDTPGMRRINRLMPSGRRCKVCLLPFLGPFSVPFRAFQLRPSRKNPNLCTF